MSMIRRGLSIIFPLSVSPTRLVLALFATLLLATTSIAQQQPQAAAGQDPQANAPAPAKTQARGPDEASITVPAGTRLALVLTHPVDSKAMRRGDEIYGETTAPVAVGDQVVIPAGTFVQGQLEKLSRQGNKAEFVMQLLSVLFPNGYVANVGGPIKIESDEGTAWRNPSSRAQAGAITAPIAGLGLGALIGSSAHTKQSSTLGGTTITSSTPKGLAIGSAVGLAAGSVVSLALLVRSHDFYVEVGAPMEMVLPQPLTLAQNQVDDAIRQSHTHPVILPTMAKPQPVMTPAEPSPFPQPSAANAGICYTPGTPATYIPGTPGTGGTPDTYVPGTPAVGETPGTPDIFIPGTPGTGGTSGTYIPGTPPIPHPCP